MVRNKIRDFVESDVTIFYPYIVPEGMRPDVLAYQYYGDTQYTWSILLVNNIIDPYWEWTLSYKDFRGYIITKYGSIEKGLKLQFINTWKRRKFRVETTGTSDPIPVYNLEVDYETYSEQILKREVSCTSMNMNKT